MNEPRLIESPIGLVVPAVDLAENIGYDRSSITKIIDANKEFFEGLKVIQTLPTPKGLQDHLCLNKAGIDRLLFFIRPHKNRKELCVRVEEFKIKAFGKMESRELVIQEPKQPIIKDELDRARMLASETGGDLAAFQAVALRKCGFGDYADALVPALKHGEAGWLNPTQIGLRCGHSAREVNHFLEWHKFQYQSSGFWRLTEKGEQFGEEYFFESPSKHREIRIRWKESILTASGLVREPSETLALARV